MEAAELESHTLRAEKLSIHKLGGGKPCANPRRLAIDVARITTQLIIVFIKKSTVTNYTTKY